MLYEKKHNFIASHNLVAHCADVWGLIQMDEWGWTGCCVQTQLNAASGCSNTLCYGHMQTGWLAKLHWSANLRCPRPGLVAGSICIQLLNAQAAFATTSKNLLILACRCLCPLLFDRLNVVLGVLHVGGCSVLRQQQHTLSPGANNGTCI